MFVLTPIEPLCANISLGEDSPMSLLFNGDIAVYPVKIFDDGSGFTFFVYNGDWQGSYEINTTSISVHYSGCDYIPKNAFKIADITKLTLSERSKWYI